MRHIMKRMREAAMLPAVLCCLLILPRGLEAQSPVRLQNFQGTIDFSAGPGPVPFTLQGTSTHLGRFTSVGEVQFTPGETPDSLIGTGVTVLKAANGDLLVGVVEWNVTALEGEYRTTQIHFKWRDSVAFSNGKVVSNTGRFVDKRPAGLVVIAIIAILIGLMLPAVQKVK